MSAAGVLPKGTGRRRNLRTQARADKGAKSVAVAAERSAGGKADFFLSPQGLSQIEVAFEIEDKGVMDKGLARVRTSPPMTGGASRRSRLRRCSFLSSLLMRTGS